MKTRNKLLLGLGIFSVITLFLGFGHRALALTKADWNGATYTITSAPGASEGVISAKLTNGDEYIFKDQDANSLPDNFKIENTPANIFFCNQSKTSASGDKGIAFKRGGASPLSGTIDIDFSTNPQQPCRNAAPPFPGIDNYKNPNITIYDATSAYTTGGTPCPPFGCPAAPPGGTGTTAKTCEASFGSGLEWMICPILRLADNAAGVFGDFIKDQLCFNTGPSSTAGGVTCSGTSNTGNNNLLTPEVEKAWGTFRVIASALLVIIMLVMVISQALGGAMFDAYTVRKILPKLVAAVILIQLSWFLTKFAINLANDVGTGIYNLLTAPFDASKLKLQYLVGQDLSTQSTGVNDAGLFLAYIAAGFALFTVSLPGLILMALYIVLAVFTAFVVLMLRKMFIILLVIAAPLAFIAWILPGTETYWKMWSKNFTKLLVMFPMIMGLIAVGRIFAFIASGGGAEGKTATAFAPHLAIAHLGPLPLPYFADAQHPFVQLAIIIFAYFGPYFLLPQTFKWGGQAMEFAGKHVKEGVDKAAAPANKYLTWRKDISPWKLAREARKAEVGRRTTEGFANRLQQGGLRGRIGRARLGGPQALIPGLRGHDAALRDSIVERTGEGLEADMLQKVQKENVEQLSGYLATGGDAEAAIRRINARRARLGLGPTNANEQREIRTNFRRFDNNGWRDNRVFAASALQATGQAGALDHEAEVAAQDLYTRGLGGPGDQRFDEAEARMGAIRFRAHTAARAAGQFASDSNSLGGAPGNPSAEWRRVPDLSKVSWDSMGTVMGGIDPNTGFTHTAEGELAAGRARVGTYSYVADDGSAQSYTGLQFANAETQRFMNEMARIRANPTLLDARQTEQYNSELRAMVTRLDAAMPGAGAAMLRTIETKAAHKHFA